MRTEELEVKTCYICTFGQPVYNCLVQYLGVDFYKIDGERKNPLYLFQQLDDVVYPIFVLAPQEIELYINVVSIETVLS